MGKSKPETKKMSKPRINALILGAGNFGRHYARILSQINRDKLPGIPFIDKLIVTRTRIEGSREIADFIRNQNACAVNAVVPAKLSSPGDLMALIEKHQPEFIAIVARDNQKGDSVHALYTAYALQSATVLCEKPFSNAFGDGSSLKSFDALFSYENKELFALELPFAVVMRQLMQSEKFRNLYRNMRNLEFFWETQVTLENYIIDDLALHPWSLIPRAYPLKTVAVKREDNKADVKLVIENPFTGLDVSCKLTLREGGNFRGMMIDDDVIGIKSEQASIKLIHLNAKLAEAVIAGAAAMEGEILLEIDNPLKQNIVAALKQEPIVNLKQTYESQVFLERLHGYVPPQT
jgi:hypothetical protein